MREHAMPLKVYYSADADPGILAGRSIAVIGYGNQGQAHARNLRESGHRVLVAQRPGRAESAAREHGFVPITPADAARQADLLILALPDEIMADIYQAQIAPHLRAGQALGFIHGLNIRFGLIIPPAD